MNIGPIVSNDVLSVPLPDGAVARIRVQCFDGGAASFLAEPGQGDGDEVAALEVIAILKEYFEARGNLSRTYRRRHRDHAIIRDVVDAVTVLELIEGPRQLLRDFQRLASSRVY